MFVHMKANPRNSATVSSECMNATIRNNQTNCHMQIRDTVHSNAQSRKVTFMVVKYYLSVPTVGHYLNESFLIGYHGVETEILLEQITILCWEASLIF